MPGICGFPGAAARAACAARAGTRDASESVLDYLMVHRSRWRWHNMEDYTCEQSARPAAIAVDFGVPTPRAAANYSAKSATMCWVKVNFAWMHC